CSSTFVCAHSWDPYNGTAATGEAYLTWTAPAAEIIDISGFLYYDHPDQQRSNDFTLTLGNTLLAQGVVSYQGYQDEAHEFTYSASGLTVAAGEVLSLELVRSNGQPYGSTDAFNWTVTVVPEPGTASATLVATGMLGLLCGVRRRTNRMRRSLPT